MNSFCKKLKFFICIQIFLISYVYPKNFGKNFFEKAYSIEKEDPDQAIMYYHKALQSGLEWELKKTTLWRLYFLYKGKKLFLQSWDILNQIPNSQNVEKKFFEDVEYFGKISKDDFIKLSSAIKNNELKMVREIFLKSSFYIKNEVLDLYLKKGLEEVIEQLLNEENYADIDSKLLLTSFYIDKKYYEQAEKILYKISLENAETISSSQKEKILYFLGKIKREKNLQDSIFYYLLSGNYSETTIDYEKALSLGMFSLYKLGYENSVYKLSEFIYNIPIDPMQKLFYFLIQAEKNPTNSNLFELKKIILNIHKDSFLVQKGKKLLKSYGYLD